MLALIMLCLRDLEAQVDGYILKAGFFLMKTPWLTQI